MANKPFNRIFKHINVAKKSVDYINAEQVTRIEILEEPRQQVIFHMSDGNAYTFSGNAASQIIKLIDEDTTNAEE